MGSLEVREAKRVCIIGAGVTGLLAIKHISQANDLIGTVFEQMDRVSGLWHYVENTEKDVNNLPVHSPVYPGLRVNACKELTQLEGFAFPDYENGKSYVAHNYMNKYLNEYADKFNLRKHIQLNTKVLNVKPREKFQPAGHDAEDFKTEWLVEVFNYKTNTKEEHVFDAVIVATGKFSEPLIPTIEGISNFKGRVLHSKHYRHPEQYKDQHVVILGFGASAIDIGYEICKVAKAVTISHRTPFEVKSTKINIVGSSIASVKSKSVVLENGDEIPCDTLILATGYKQHFPFLDRECGITVEENKYIRPLYRHIHNINYPTLCLMNTFPFSDDWGTGGIQAKYLVKYLQGHVRLPMENKRWKALEAREAEWKSQNLPVHHWGKMGKLGEEVYPYLVTLARDAGIPEATRNLELKRVAIYTGIGRLFQHDEVFRTDSFTWIDSISGIYRCSADSKGPEEILAMKLDEATGKVNITSSLGEIQNKEFVL